MCVCVCVCVCVCGEVTEVYDTMSGLPIVSDIAATKGSKYLKLGRQTHKLFNSKYLLQTDIISWGGATFLHVGTIVTASLCSNIYLLLYYLCHPYILTITLLFL